MQYRKRYPGLDKRLTGAIIVMLLAPALCAAGFILAVFWKATLLLLVLAALACISTVLIRGAAGIPG